MDNMIKNKKLSNSSSEESTGGAQTLFWFILVVIVIIGIGVYLVTRGGGGEDYKDAEIASSTITEDGKQILNLKAKNGYSPSTITASANQVSVLKIQTSNTYDCSTIMRIPSLGVGRTLPPNGTTSIEIPSQKSGTELRGTCGMGMYYFTIKFT